MSPLLLGILNSQAAGGAAQNHYVGISDFAINAFAYGMTANSRLVGVAGDGPSGDVGTIAQLDGSGVVLSANDIRTNVGGGDNRSRVRIGRTFGGVDYLGVTGEVTGNSDTHTIKLASDGSIDWGRYIGRGTGGSNNVTPYDLTVDSAGNVYTLVSDYAGSCVVIAKWNSSGTLQWKYAYGNVGVFDVTGRSGALSTDASGNLYLYQWVTDNSATAYGSLGSVIKINPSTGAVVFQKYFEFADDSAFCTGVSDSAGNSYVSVRAQNGPGSFDNWGLPVVKYDSSGNYQWAINLVVGVAETCDAPAKPVIDSNGNCIIACHVGGSTESLLIYSVDPTGSINWQRLVSNSLSSRPYIYDVAGLNIDDNDNVFLAGYWRDATPTFQHYGLVFPADGNFLGSYTDGTYTWTVSAASTTDYGAPTQRTPAVSFGTATEGLTEGATTMQQFSRSYTLNVLEA